MDINEKATGLFKKTVDKMTEHKNKTLKGRKFTSSHYREIEKAALNLALLAFPSATKISNHFFNKK